MWGQPPRLSSRAQLGPVCVVIAEGSFVTADFDSVFESGSKQSRTPAPRRRHMKARHGSAGRQALSGTSPGGTALVFTHTWNGKNRSYRRIRPIKYTTTESTTLTSTEVASGK